MGIVLPQIRESNGNIDWRQLADFIIPGNVWNSRTNQYRPIGMAAGAASMVGGPLAGAAVELGGQLRGHFPQLPRFGNPFSGMSSGVPRIRVVGSNPPSYRNNLPSVNVVPRWNDAGASRPDVDPRVASGASGQEGSGDIEADGIRLGLGQLGRAGDEAMIYYSQAMRNRNGALMER